MSDMKTRHWALLALLWIGHWGHAMAQSTSIQVVDSAMGVAIDGAQVRYQLPPSTRWQALSVDSAGTAQLAVGPAQRITLQARHIGYRPLTISGVGGRGIRLALLPDTRALDPVVVTAQALPRASSRAVARVRVIGQAQIRAQGATNLRELLSQQLGVRLQQDGVLGTGVSLNGLSGQHVKIMVDGVPVVGRSDGQLDLSQLNLAQVAAVEIVEGPLSVEYGSDALGGTINLITRTQGPGKWQLHANTYWESVGSYNAEGGLGVQGQRHSLQLHGGRYFFDGYSPVDSSRDQLWNPKEQYFASWQYGLRQPSWQLTVKGNYYRELITDRGRLRPPYYETAFDHQYRTRRLDHALHAQGRLGRQLHWDLVAGLNQFTRRNNQYFKDLTTLETVLTPSVNQDTNGFVMGMSRGQMSQGRDSSRCQWKIGYDWKTEVGTGPRIADQQKSLTDIAGFASAEIRLADWVRVQPGLRYGYHSAYSAPLSPALHLWLRPARDWTIRTAAARGFRAPSIKELYLSFQDINHDITGNPDLRAEYSLHVSASPSYQHLCGQTLVRAEGSVWLNLLRDQISLVQSADRATAYTYRNLHSVRTQGTRAQCTVMRGAWQGEVGGNLLGSTSGLDLADDPLRYSWEANFRLQVEIPRIAVQVAGFYKYTGVRRVVLLGADDALVLGTQAAYHWLDLSASRRFCHDRLLLSLGGKNLLNIQNLLGTTGTGGTHGGSAAETPLAWGRTAFIQLSYDIQ
jgi:outer membrane receptor for ferrienterochelin and colicins